MNQYGTLTAVLQTRGTSTFPSAVSPFIAHCVSPLHPANSSGAGCSMQSAPAMCTALATALSCPEAAFDETLSSQWKAQRLLQIAEADTTMVLRSSLQGVAGSGDYGGDD